MEISKTSLTTFPHSPGVYMYTSRNGEILYIGKAKDLKKRITQYFTRDDAIGAKTALLVSQIASIQVIETASEFDALLLEAKLIHEKLPKYNVVLKDGKSPLYILLTLSEPLPHVLIVRRSDIPKTLGKQDALFGPFQSATVVRSMLRRLRYTIPYCTQKTRTGKPCFYSHLGLCNPCPSERNVNKTLYRKNIYRLKNILSGKSHTVLKELEKDMNTTAALNNFEEAATLRNHIQNLYHMIQKQYDPSLYTDASGGVQSIYQKELASLTAILQQTIPTLQMLHRIECVDISNIQGTNATGSLVVLTEGAIDTSSYRRFKIKNIQTPNDIAMMREVILRRLHHSQWPMPDLFIVDGGKQQVAAVRQCTDIPVIGIAKREEELIIPIGNKWKILRIPFSDPALHLVQRIRDEAHRFALSYHRLLRNKSFDRGMVI